MTWPKQAGHTWRFSKVRTRASDNPSTEVADTSGPNVTATETWEQMLGNLDGAWRTWSREAETWLLATNRLSNRAPERFLGEVPTIIVPGSHHVAPNQGISERQLRRHIRRLDETLFLVRRGTSVPESLFKNVQRGCVSQAESRAIRARKWGEARNLAQSRLQDLLATQSREAVSKWKQRVHTVSGACKWLRQDLAVPYVVKNDSGEILIIRNQAVEALRHFWSNIFGTPENQINVAEFCNYYSEDFPPSRHRWNLSPFLQSRFLKSVRF